jgi:hypothetical protein
VEHVALSITYIFAASHGEDSFSLRHPEAIGDIGFFSLVFKVSSVVLAKLNGTNKS